MTDTYDKATKLLIASEDLEQAKFFLTLLNRVAVRVGAEYDTPVNTKSVDIINDYVISKVDVPVNTEVEIELPINTKMVFIKTRKISRLRVATIAGETEDDKAYSSRGKGGSFSQGRTNIPVGTKKLYCRVTTSDNIREVLIAIYPK